MVFSSIFFIFCFLPVFLLLYYLVPGRLKDLILFLGSLFFYAWGGPVYLILMLFSAFFNYYIGLDLASTVGRTKKKHTLIFAIIINVGILCFFKYYGFLLETIGSITGLFIPHPELGLPIGISFYTFKNLSYIFDVYSGKISPQKNFLTFGVYSTMFPHMAAGPIVRYSDIEDQLKKRTVSLYKLGLGAECFLKGLVKKVIIADNLALIFAAVSGSLGKNSVLTSWIGLAAYTLEIYFDFSGYSDMAIGLGKMLGFDFQKNFDYPYTSNSITEFWRRWHISLGSWFRDYIYIPLGGNRAGTLAQIRNILIVWALTGLWHGASWNFVLWGVYYGIVLLLEKFVLSRFLKSAPTALKRIYTIFLVMIGWVFFCQTSFHRIVLFFGGLFGFSAPGFLDRTALYYLKTGGILMIVGILACHPNLQIRFRRLMRVHPWAAVSLDLILFALAISYMVFNSYSPFLYQQF